MSEYQLTQPEEPCTILREADGASIPPDPANRDYDEYLKWKDNGGVPDPCIPPPEPAPPQPTPEDELLYNHENRIRELEGQPPLSLDEFAEARKK